MGLAVEDGVFEGLGRGPAPGTERGEFGVEPGGVGGKVAFSGSHLMNAAREEFRKTHKVVRGKGGREGVPGRGRRHGGPLAEEDGPGFLFHCRIRVLGWVGRGDGEGGDKVRVEEGERGAVLQEGEDSVGDFIDREMLADVPLRGLPHEGAFRGVEFGPEGAMALAGPEGGLIRYPLVETSSGWVYLWGGGGEPKGRQH